MPVTLMQNNQKSWCLRHSKIYIPDSDERAQKIHFLDGLDNVWNMSAEGMIEETCMMYISDNIFFLGIGLLDRI